MRMNANSTVAQFQFILHDRAILAPGTDVYCG